MSSKDAPPRLLYALAAAIVAVAAVGFLTATSERESMIAREARATMTLADDTVPSYADLGERRRGPNASLSVDAFDRLAAALPGLTDEVVRTGDIEALRAKRAARRAFDGAPPTIPHPISQRGLPPCLACHERGAVVGGLIAPAMSHQRYDSCTQCHVPETAPFGPVAAISTSFVGARSPGSGARAWEGAPPMIPHPLAMRERCMSCHGIAGASPIRTTHPWRQSCQQCHAPDAALTRDNFPLLGERR